MPRFVLLWHETPAGFARPPHWDLMLEAGSHLRCWALAAAPDETPQQSVEALADHRLTYLDYEGPISGERGAVSRHDQGEYQSLVDEVQEVRVLLRGQRLRGTLTLRREPDTDQRWRLSFVPD